MSEMPVIGVQPMDLVHVVQEGEERVDVPRVRQPSSRGVAAVTW